MLYLIPFIIFLGESGFLNEQQSNGRIPNGVHIESIKYALYGIGSLLTVIGLSIPLAYNEFKNQVLTKQVLSLIKYNKDNLLALLFAEGLIKHKEINIRIFVPKISFLQYLKKLINIKLNSHLKVYESFAIKNIEMLAHRDKTEGLSYRVSPKEHAEGLIGECYNTKQFVMEDRGSNTFKKRKLTKFQETRTSQLLFNMCYPIIDKNTDDVIAIVAFDSEREVPVDLDKRSSWLNIISNYSFTLFDYTPDLFR